MASKSSKDKALLAIAGVIVLYVIAGFVWFVHSSGAWKTSSKNYARECDRFAREEKLISEKQKWKDAYDAERETMPLFEQGKSTDTVWLAKVEEIAKKNLVLISNIEHGEEVEADDVYEIQIKVRFEASLEALVKFMHEVENSGEGMFDMKALSMHPSSKKGYLTGSFTLTCAYMREG